MSELKKFYKKQEKLMEENTTLKEKIISYHNKCTNMFKKI